MTNALHVVFWVSLGVFIRSVIFPGVRQEYLMLRHKRAVRRLTKELENEQL